MIMLATDSNYDTSGEIIFSLASDYKGNKINISLYTDQFPSLLLGSSHTKYNFFSTTLSFKCLFLEIIVSFDSEKDYYGIRVTRQVDMLSFSPKALNTTSRQQQQNTLLT